MKKGSLTHETISGIFWQSSSAAGNLVVRTLVLIILARHLRPEDFGVVTAALLVSTVTQTIAQGGIPKALVQRLTLEEQHFRSAFAIALYSGAAASLLLLLAAPQLAMVLGIPRAEPVIRVFSVLVLLNGINAVSTAALRRDRKFKLSSALDLLTFCLGYGAVGILLALTGFGMWSLVAAQVSQMVLRTFLFMVAARSPIGFWPQREAARELYRLGSGYSAGTLGNLVAAQVDYFVVGRLLGAGPLGLYNRAYNFLMLPAQLIGTASQMVLFPSFASIQDQPARVSRAFLRGTGVIAMSTLPLSGVLIVLAPELVVVTLGGHWREMIVPFQILAGALLFRTSYKISDSLALAMGVTYERAVRQWFYAAAVAAGAAIGSRWGLPGVSVGVTLAVIFNFLSMLSLALRLTGVSGWNVLAMHVRHALAAVPIVVAVAAVVAFARYEAWPDYGVLAIGLITAGAVFLLMWWRVRAIFGEDGEWVHALAASRLRRPVKASGS